MFQGVDPDHFQLVPVPYSQVSSNPQVLAWPMSVVWYGPGVIGGMPFRGRRLIFRIAESGENPDRKIFCDLSLGSSTGNLSRSRRQSRSGSILCEGHIADNDIYHRSSRRHRYSWLLFLLTSMALGLNLH